MIFHERRPLDEHSNNKSGGDKTGSFAQASTNRELSTCLYLNILVLKLKTRTHMTHQSIGLRKGCST